ncbi:TIGR03750 family conjugal transfer protein [Providencia sp.]|uniref:TIGR03750 family conjugal transfer protein n=1 Tax=Providencia sp. TaxID=589 RepID=UPI003340D2F5
MKNYLLEDATVNFLPNRLNRQPIVFRGLTADELWLTVGVTGILGLILGIGVASFTGQIGFAPTTVLVSIAVGIFVGGGFLRRQKRGRPDTWLYRQIQWNITCKYPTLGGLLGGNSLINRSGWWEIKRYPSTRKNQKNKGDQQ